MTVVSEFVATLGVTPNRASFAAAEGMLGGLARSAGRVATGFAALFAAREIGHFFASIKDEGDALGHAAVRIGITAQNLQALGLAAKLSGSNMDELQTGLKFLQRSASEAASGGTYGKEFQPIFASLGITLKQSNGRVKDTRDLLGDLADAIQKIPDPARRTDVAMRLLGRGGAAMIPVLAQGRKGLEDVYREAEQLGGGLGDNAVQASMDLQNSLTRLSFASLSLKSSLATALFPALADILTAFTKWVGLIREFVRGSQFMQSAIFVVTAALVVWGVSALFARTSTLRLMGLLTLFAAVVDDVRVGLRGGKSALGEWLDKAAGLGTFDNLVRNIANGWQILNEAIRDFLNLDFGKLKVFLKEILPVLGGPLGMAWAARDAIADASKRADVDRTRAALEARAAKGDKAAQAELVRFNAQTFGEGTTIPRATARGLGAAVEAGPLFGRASVSAVNAGLQNAPLIFGSGTATTNAKGAVVITQQAETTVNVQSGASAAEIARHVRRGVQEGLDGAAQNIRHSIGRRPQSATAAPVGTDADIDGTDQ